MWTILHQQRPFGGELRPSVTSLLQAKFASNGLLF
jgi:hypothetical protein